MNSDCGILNPLQRDGTSQNQRLLHILHPSSIQVDERDIGDLLGYARNYAKLLRYYNAANQEDGDWETFIKADISTLVSIIRDTDLAANRRAFDATEHADLETKIALIIELGQLADEWALGSLPGLQLRTALEKLIPSILNDGLRATIAYALRALELGIPISPEWVNVSAYSANLWELSNIQADPLLFPSDDPTNTEDLQEAHNQLKQVFQRLADGLQTIINAAPEYLEETLEAHPSHQPHMALFLAFLKIFEVAQRHLNTLTRTHLNFYYREVLQLSPLPANPDMVHMIFELAKGFAEEKVDKKTALKAGKDDLGIPMWFETDDEIIVNKAQLDEEGLKTLFIEKNEPTVLNPFYTVQNLYAAPKANSADGLGAEIIEEEDGKWLTMGSKDMPQAEIGFAISSPMLLLQEGERVIQLTCHFDADADWLYGKTSGDRRLAAEELTANLIPYYTGPEGWVRGLIDQVLISTHSGITITIYVRLLQGAEPFVAYNPAIFTEGFKTQQPVLKLMMDPNGLCGSSFCGSRDFLTEKSQAPDLIPPNVQKRMLAFLNAASSWEAIGAIEPEDGPVYDNPFTGSAPGNERRGYDIGEDVSKYILERREDLGGAFTDITQLLTIAGLGVDKLNDLYYTFCREDRLANIKSCIGQFVQGNAYTRGDCVLHQGEYYRALRDNPPGAPSAGSANWNLVPRSHPYKYFKGLKLEKIEVAVDVTGMKNLILENDIGLINPSKPFLPFGPAPKVGSKFYIGNAEVFQKKLNYPKKATVELALEWADLPETSFSTHYGAYPSKPSNNNDFKVKVEKQVNGQWSTLLISDFADENQLEEGQFMLFEQGNNANRSPIPQSPLLLADLFSNHHPSPKTFSQLSPEVNRGFLRMVLTQHFFHRFYPAAVTQYVTPDNGANIVPNEPYTPTISSINLSYRTTEEVNFRDKKFNCRQTQLFHIEPFGWKEIYPFDNGVPAEEAVVSRSLVPEFLINEKGPGIGIANTSDAAGTLYIGFKDLVPPQAVSILIQMAEGSSDPGEDPQKVVWSYMSNNQWKDFQTHEILADGTNGLLTSGIIQFGIPREITKENTSLKAGIHWIKASVANKTHAIAKTIAVLPQAVKATFQLSEEHDQNRLNQALTEGTVNKLRERQAAIKKVKQPYASFGGKVKEQVEAPAGVSGEALFRREYNEYYIRVSERLRHKHRPITIYDYERMVLQHFPDVYKVKCLNHTSINRVEPGQAARPRRTASEHAPGQVKLIVLPKLFNQNAVNRLEPQISSNRLSQIGNYLRPLMSGFVKLEVRNPVFEKIEVSLKVKFHPLQEANRGFYETQLIEDIKRFLSPWAFEEGQDLVLGARVHRSVILNYIENRSYVDFVTDFQMNHWTSETDVLTNVEEAVATTSSSVIVSYSSHTILPEIPSPCKEPASS